MLGQFRIDPPGPVWLLRFRINWWLSRLLLKLLFGAILLALLGVLLSRAHATEDWHSYARLCAETLSRARGGCGSCNGLWPEIARCVMTKVAPDVQSWVTDACVYAVRSRTESQPMGFDRIGPVLSCATHQSFK